MEVRWQVVWEQQLVSTYLQLFCASFKPAVLERGQTRKEVEHRSKAGDSALDQPPSPVMDMMDGI